jgi:hypothetical protein
MNENMKSALVNAEGGYVGAKVTADAVMLQKLESAGLIGKNDGLTIRGTIKREQLISAALDEAF